MTKKTILQSLPSDTEIMYEDIVWLLELMEGAEDNNLETYKHDLSIEKISSNRKVST